jgi:Xylose isomerase-like TIM barrel
MDIRQNLITRRELLQGMAAAVATTALAPVVGSAQPTLPVHKIKRGVSLYSYQEEFYLRAMTLDDCLSEASSIGAFGIEMLPEEMMPGYPNPSQEWVDQWFAMHSKHHTIPETYTQFQDTYLTLGHDLNSDEGVRFMERDLRLAKRLGFRNLRLLIGTPLDVIERSIPLAEELDLRMNVEIHAPCLVDGPAVHEWVEIIEKHKTKHFGLNPDMGLFVMREERIDRDRRIRDGQVRKDIAVFIDKAYEDKMPESKLAIELEAMEASPGEIGYMHAVYTPGGQDVQKLKPLVPYSHHIHAKFYEMTEDYQEYSIPYDQIVQVLVDGGYDGYLASEWEGQRTTQDAVETDSCEQVRRQHVMLKRLLGEV